MPTVTRQGASVHYEVAGDGPAVLLGHSLLCDGGMWDQVAPRLAERYRVINIDFRGHRRSTAPGPFALEDLAGDFLAVMDQEGAARAAMIGLSMGAMTALRAALLAPARVAGMVLLDTSAAPEGRWRRLQYALMAMVYRRAGLIPPLEKRVLPLMFGTGTLAGRPELVEQFRARVREHDRRQLGHAIDAVTRRGDLSGRLAEIDCPVLVAVGEDDLATTPDRSRRIQQGIRGARLELIADAGHLSAVEQPERVTELCLDLLAQCTWDAPASAQMS
jgi:3-oxoadipate enol-lactonase